MLLSPPADSWPTYHGDYSGRHHSSLTQITPANVGTLTQAWKFQITGGVKATPILVNGVIYISSPDNVWAIDASPTLLERFRLRFPSVPAQCSLALESDYFG